MEIRQGAAVADADQHGVAHFVAQQRVEGVLQTFVHGRGGFVEEDDLRPIEQDPGEGQALLLADGEDARPVGADVQAVHQVGEVDLAQCLLQARLVIGPAGGRVGNGGTQVAQGQVGALGEEQRPVAAGASHLALGVGPETGQRAQQGGLAAARGALDQQGLARLQAEVEVGHQPMAVGAQHLQARDIQRVRLIHTGHPGQVARLLVGIEEAAETVEGGAVPGEGVVRLAEERQRVLHLAEGLGGLHHVAQLDGATEEARCLEDKGEHHGDLADGEVEAIELQAPVDQRPDIADQRGEPPQQRAPLNLRTLVEGHVFGVLAQAHQGVAEVRGELLVEEVQADQRAPEAEGDPGRDYHVEVHGEDHRPGDFHARNHQRRRQPPEDAGEGHQRNQRADGAEGEGHRARDEGIHIQLDTLVGVVHRLGEELPAVIGITVHPVTGQAVGQPYPPVDVEGLGHVVVEQRAQHMNGREDREHPEEEPEGLLVQPLQGAVEAVVPEREQHVHAHREQRQHQQQGEDQQGTPAALRAEVGAGDLPELASPAGEAHRQGRCGGEGDKGDERGDCEPAQALLQGLVPIHFHAVIQGRSEGGLSWASSEALDGESSGQKSASMDLAPAPG
ncbi:hypothetical protein D9M68_526750 [compost metagenome]